jgi:acetyl-CoA carboxylase biotin carboxyl carrier protein
MDSRVAKTDEDASRPLCVVESDPPMPTDVRAHITGTVWKVEVLPGERVEKSQTLVILESMKMEIPVEAPQAGTVDRVSVAAGQSVEEGDLLITLKP